MRALPLLFLSCVLAAEDEPPVRGLDVIDSVRTVSTWLGPGTPDPQKPWASSLGALTDPDPSIHAPAIRDLVVRGSRQPRVIDDLSVLSQDGDWRVRARVVQVLEGIGGAGAVPLLVALSRDREARVRELSALALGKGSGPDALTRLQELAVAPEPTIRQAAAASLGAFGDPAAIACLAKDTGEGDDLVQRERERALMRLAADPASVPHLLALLPTSTGQSRDLLLGTAAVTADRRLTPVLAKIAQDPGTGATGRRRTDPSAWTQYLALDALDRCGDLRAVPVLLGLVRTGGDDVATRAARTLVSITGFQAQAGSAWTVWANDRAQDLPRWQERDAWLATLHDPTSPVERSAVSQYSPQELSPLVDAVLNRPEGRLAPWFPRRALVALRSDDPARWTPVLADRVIASRDGRERLGLILLIDDLDGPHALTDLGRILADLKARIAAAEEAAEAESTPPANSGPELAALEGALRRRQPR